MSFDAHEAFSFDSFSQQLLFWDDFEGDALKDLWATTGDAGGTAVVVDAQTGGVVRITTDGDNLDTFGIDWGSIRTLHVDQKAVMEVRVKLASVSDVAALLQLRFDFNNRIYLQLDTSVDGNWHAITTDGGVSTNTDTGEAADTDYHVFRIETSATSVTFYIDDVLEATHTTNIPDDAGDYLQPQLFTFTRTAAAKTMDIDYCYVRQERG